MGSRTEIQKQSKRVDSILDLLNSAEEVEKEIQDLDVKYLQDGEDEWLERRGEEGVYKGIRLGYPKLEELIGGFEPGELFTIGGDTGHGKSLFAMNLAQNVYKEYQRPVLVVNLELTEDQARERFYNLSGDEHDYAGIMIQKSPAVSYKDIDILMKKAKQQDACLVIIDHLHFFSRNQDNQTGEISRIMMHFKECAVENKLPVILLSHVTPKREHGQDGEVTKTHRPGLHNLKNSSSIEQDSDMVGFVYRLDDDKTKLEFYLRKNRSRELKTYPIIYQQTGWKLEEQWWEIKK